MLANLHSVHRTAFSVGSFVVLALGSARAFAAAPQGSSCQPGWIPTFGGTTGVTGTPYALTTFDDGSGGALYVGGYFSMAGTTPVNNVAKWDGANWSVLGSGVQNGNGSTGINAWAVFDDGAGVALYAAGVFTLAGGSAANNIAKWNGTRWSALGTGLNSTVFALEVFDDGSGDALYAAGAFTQAGGAPASRIAKWDGASWSPLGSGLNGLAHALAVFDDGSGPALCVGGDFDMAGGVPVNNVAKWNGANWSPLGSGIAGSVATVAALHAFDDGNGAALYAGGYFVPALGAPGSHVAKWDGASWSALGTGMDYWVYGLCSFDDGGGPALYAAGDFTVAGGNDAVSIAKWDGANWSPLGTGATYSLRALTVFDDGAGAALFAAGDAPVVGSLGVNGVARWSGSSWSALGNGFDDDVYALTTHDDGNGRALYAAGWFASVTGGVPAPNVARWAGANWSSLGSGVSGQAGGSVPYQLESYDDGNGPALYVTGAFTAIDGVPANRIAKWDGASWSALGGGLTGNGFVAGYALAVYDDGTGPALFVGGSFTHAGGIQVNRIAKWDGANWSPLWIGANNGSILALEVFDDGNGPQLYAGGSYFDIGGVPARYLAKWDGAWWSLVGDNTNTIIFALRTFDDGSGPALYVGGSFTLTGGTGNGITKWDGTSWSQLGSGCNDSVSSLEVFDDGSGPQLVAGGQFTSAGGVAANRIAAWNGSNWSALGNGLNDQVAALGVFDDGVCGQPALFVGGAFTNAFDSGDSYLAKWGCSSSCGVSYCTAGLTSHGCNATMTSSGAPSVAATSGFVLSASQVEGLKQGLLFYGTSGAIAVPWGGGSSSYLCVNAPTQRTLPQSSGGTSNACDGVLAFDFLAFVAANPGALGAPFSAGDTVWTQAWFRDPPAPKTTSLSDALRFTLTP